MTNDEAVSRGSGGWRKTAALLLALAVVGIPVNQFSVFALLVVSAVIIFSGEVTIRSGSWMAAIAAVGVVVIAQILLAPPRIEEGHNVFLPSPALKQVLPADVYRYLASEFDAVYPPAVRCKPHSPGCWQNQGLPDKPFAFSADGILWRTEFSRAVTSLDFSDPVWLRLGFINEVRYNWYTAAPDVHRADRDRRFWMGWHRWHLTMPWFEMIRFPASYIGGELCWRGELMREGADNHFSRSRGNGCRTIEPDDAGRRIFGIAIRPGTLAMHIRPPLAIQMQQFIVSLLTGAGIVAVIAILVRFRARRTLLPFVLIGLAVLVIAINDSSFLGGVRPLDGGDDGLFYDGYGRIILQKLLAGDISGFLEGGEKVFFYGGPGLRYFRAIEHIIFGESYLGYLSLVLLMPIVLYGIFRRFLPDSWSLGLILLFIVIPVGVLFGTSFTQYAKWAARGFADPAAYILFLCAILPLVGTTSAGPENRIQPAFFGALLLALSVFMKPIVAPAAAVLLAGAGFAALYFRQWPKILALCIGFLPVFSMALHNWFYGHVFVLFSANSRHPDLLVMPPSAYVAAARELVAGDLGGVERMAMQLADWLSGPAEAYWTIPLSAAGVAILGYVVVRRRQFDPWLRLVGAAALAQHAVALFYNAATARYHFLTWLLTMLVVMVFIHQVALDWLERRYPALSAQIAAQSWRLRLASGLSYLQKMST